MKQSLIVISYILILSIVACKKDDSNVYLQPHDSNRMMDSMHAMMTRMEAVPVTNDPEIDFAKMMIIHHEGAISMANLELSDGKNDSLKRTAQKIITEQLKEIKDLNVILSMIDIDNSDPVFTMEHMESMEKMGKTADVQLISGDIDNDFAALMIVHHQAAIDNASGYLHHGNNTQLKTMAANIVNSQTREIKEMADWLKANKR